MVRVGPASVVRSMSRFYFVGPRSCVPYSKFIKLKLDTAGLTASPSPIVGSADQIASFRSRYAQLTSSIAHHEARVAKQETRLDRKNRPKHLDDDEEDREDEVSSSLLSGEDEHPCDITEDDLEREQAEIQELDKKKRALEERVAGMERDLGGLQR